MKLIGPLPAAMSAGSNKGHTPISRIADAQKEKQYQLQRMSKETNTMEHTDHTNIKSIL
jgi:hypothetical protein